QRGPFLGQRCRDGKLGGVARDEEVQAKWQGGSPAKVADLRTDIVCAAVPRCQEPETAGLTYGRRERRRGGSAGEWREHDRMSQAIEHAAHATKPRKVIATLI